MSESPRAAADIALKASGPPQKSYGEFSALAPSYGSAYRPARMGLRRVLDSGMMMDPMQMPQSGSTPWSMRRPATVDSSSSRPNSRGGTRPPTIPAALTGPGQAAADRGPDVLRPQRIELPTYLHTPARRPDGEPISDQERTMALKKVQDLELLTRSCKRANKTREEGRAYFSLGVLRDNMGQHHKAIESYNHFLRVCKEVNDNQGCGLAYHCIGVNHQLLAGGAGSPGSGTPGYEGEEVKPEQLRKAIFYHNKHREGADSVGKFVAHLNMGLAYALLGEKEASTVNHQYALRYALQLHSLEGQSLAIGSLGFSAGSYEHDPGKMGVLIERYMELCGALKQPRNQTSALQKLGTLAGKRGDNEQSAEYFRQARECARAQGNIEAELDSCVMLGVAEGQAKMEQHLGMVLERAIVQSGGM